MPAPRSAKVSLVVQLTADEVGAIRAERHRRGRDATLSSVFEDAVRDLLASDLRTLVIPSLQAGPLLRAAYRISRPTEARLNEALALHRYTLQNLVRAAVHRLDAGQGPTHTGR